MGGMNGSNLFQLSNTLKGLSDQQLAASMNSPAVPPYLVVAELKRREAMRQQGGEQPPSPVPQQKTVTQDLLERLRQAPVSPQASPGQPGFGAPGAGAPGPTPPGGQLNPPSAGPPGMAQGIAGLLPGRGRATGGFIRRFQDGSDQPVSPRTFDIDYTGAQVGAPAGGGIQSLGDFLKLYQAQAPTIEQVGQQVRSLQPVDQFAPITAELARQQQQRSTRRVDPWQALAQAGFAMAAAPTASFGRAAGIAGQAALGNVQQQRLMNQALQEQNLMDRLNLAKAQAEQQDRMAAATVQGYHAAQQNAAQLAQAAMQHQDKAAELAQNAQVAQSHAEFYKAQAQQKTELQRVAAGMTTPEIVMSIAKGLGQPIDRTAAVQFVNYSAPQREAILESWQSQNAGRIKTAELRMQGQLQAAAIRAANRPGDTYDHQEAVEMMKSNPDYFYTIPKKEQPAVAKLWTSQTQLPAPAQLRPKTIDQLQASGRALTMIDDARAALQDPDIKKNIGPILGRLGEGEQLIGTSLRLTPEQEQKAQALRSFFTYMRFAEAQAVFGSRVPAALMSTLEKGSPTVTKDLPMIQGALDGIGRAANSYRVAAEKERFGGKMRPDFQSAGAADTGGAKQIIVKAGDGTTHPFNSEKEAQTFESLVKSQGGTTSRQ